MADVTFLPWGVHAEATEGEILLDVARRSSVPLAAPCNGRGRCGRCAVRIVSGSLKEPDESEKRLLRYAADDVRLACRASVAGDVVVEAVVVETRGGSVSDAGDGPFALAVDLGTTTVAAAIVDLSDGRTVATGAAPNAQSSWGADVLSRLVAARTDGAALARAAEGSIIAAAQAASRSAEVSLGDIVRVVIAGNSAMAAILSDASGESLLTPPFIAPRIEGALSHTPQLRDLIAPGAAITVLPPLHGFVGGDSTAAVIGIGLLEGEGPRLLVDLGTNAEILLSSSGRLYVASAAAGPAFEGGGVSCGGPAIPGAVVSVRIADGEVSVSPPSPTLPWMTGSGVISALAALRSHGVVDAGGRLLEAAGFEDRIARDDSGVLGFRITDSHAPIVLTQLDIRAVQTAKAAVIAGIEVVLAAAGVFVDELESVSIAGAFGSALDPSDLVSLGIVPAVAPQRISTVGNAALAGASLIVGEAGDGGLEVDIEGVDLAGNIAFERAFLAGFDLVPRS